MDIKLNPKILDGTSISLSLLPRKQSPEIHSQILREIHYGLFIECVVWQMRGPIFAQRGGQIQNSKV